MDKHTTRKPELFGLVKSNRDFSKAKSWGKNIFNNAFPAALACYMNSKGLPPIYFTLNDQKTLNRGNVVVDEIFGITPSSPNVYFAFESDFVPYQLLVVDNLPRADLVVIDESTGLCTSGIEIKLTALPDNSTFNLPEDRYGCEVVVRPDTIVYLALSIAASFKADPNQLLPVLRQLPKISNWTDVGEVAPVIPQMADVLDDFMAANINQE